MQDGCSSALSKASALPRVQVEADPDQSMSIQNVFGGGDSYNSLLWSTFFVTLVTWGLFRVQYHKDGRLMTIFNKEKGAQPIMKMRGACCRGSLLATAQCASRLPS